MKPDRHTLLIGTAFIAAAALLTARQEQRAACVGGSCSPLLFNLGPLPTNSVPSVATTNAKALRPASESLTNRSQ